MLSYLHKSRILRVLFSLSFFLSGILLNLIQFVAYITIGYFDIKLYRKVNYYLIYSSWSQIVAFSEWWSGSSLRLYFADEESYKTFATNHTLFIMNHRYELDWLFAWLCCDKYGVLGNAKSFAKKSLRWLPVIGWGWLLDEFIFLERNWQKDGLKLGQSLDKIMSYEDPISLLLFAEGTRFTQDKYDASLEFARQRGLPRLKYHLLPRIKGFAFCIQLIKQKYPNALLYDIQLKFPNDMQHEPSFTSILKGKPCNGDLYCRRIPLDSVPTDNDEEISNFLYDVYKRKDDLMEYYETNGKFPGFVVEYPRRIAPLLNWLGWFAAIMFLITYGLWHLFCSRNLYLIVPISCIFAFGLISIYFLIGSTKIKKGSKYGNGSQDNPNQPNSPKSDSENEANVRKRKVIDLKEDIN